MRRIKLTVAYDGTDYCGWQVQNNGATIEGELNTALTQLTGQTVKVIGRAGRMQGFMREEMWLYLIQNLPFHRNGFFMP